VQNHLQAEGLRASLKNLTKLKHNLKGSLRLADKYLTYIEAHSDRFIYMDSESAKALKADLQSQLVKSEEDILTAERHLATDFGPNKQFIGLLDQCLERHIGNYLYKVCMFSEALQIEGTRSFNLG
jgi:hypothetical protein